jgi:hypothetical protein
MCEGRLTMRNCGGVRALRVSGVTSAAASLFTFAFAFASDRAKNDGSHITASTAMVVALPYRLCRQGAAIGKLFHEYNIREVRGLKTPVSI